jgi:hypothetical protein
MSKRNIFLLLLFCTTNYLFSESIPYSFLRYNTSARATALANAFEAVNGDASAVILNPATINTISTKPLSFTFTKNILDINSGNVSYVREFENMGTFAAHAVYSNFGSFDEYDRNGTKLGNFGASDLALGFSYGNELDTNLFYGVTLKYVYSGIQNYSSSALAFDAGLLYNLKDNRTSFALAILNAGFQLALYNGENEKLPVDVRIGANHRLVGLPLLASISFHHLADETDNFGEKLLSFSIGGEIYIGKYVNIRIGYDNKIRQNTSPESEKKLAGLSAGIGIIAKSFNFDYGLQQLGTAFLIHKFSANIQL